MSAGDIINGYGQRAGDCLDFCHSGKKGNCQRYPDWQDVNHSCVICDNKFCEKYDDGKGK